MDKIFSTRVNESILTLLDELSKRFHKPKKKIIEEAIEQYAKSNKDAGFNILEETSGCWQRNESVEETISTTRKKFQENFSRYQS